MTTCCNRTVAPGVSGKSAAKALARSIHSADRNFAMPFALLVWVPSPVRFARTVLRFGRGPAVRRPR